MDWILRGPQIHSTFSNLGYVQTDGYHVNENCNSALEEILDNILAEDKYLRNYRRNIGFGQNIQKDLIPLLIHTDEDKTVNLIIKILVNLTIPVECLLNVEIISKTNYGRHSIFEINNLLASTKVAFTELQTSKVVIEFLKRNVDVEPMKKLSEEQLNNVSNCLLLLRNIVHIPEYNGYFHSTCNGSNHLVQNQIIWNIFSQSIDKVIIKAMTIRNANFYGVAMVQLVALLYKDQHDITLLKLLNNWHETSLYESSEDNESNTSPTERGSDDSSSMLISSDATSDSSGSPGPCSKADSASSGNNGWGNDPSVDSGAPDDSNQLFQTCDQDFMDSDMCTSSQNTYQDNSVCDDKSAEAINEDHIKLEMADLANLDDREDQNNRKQIISDTSDCGYGTQIENQEFGSSSSNDAPKKPFHITPHIAKRRPNKKPRPSTTLQDRKKRKIVKRVKANIVNIQGLFHKTPSDDDITKVIKEFTVDFLLKGYNSLVQTLHHEILTNREFQIDTSHFFWLFSFFLKFATQMELDLELLDSVLCFEIVSYLVAEAVNLCEQFELAIKCDGTDLSPIIRRQLLVVSSIREFVQAIEVYKKIPLSNEADHEKLQKLQKLQIKMSEAQDLSSLLVLLLRHYDPRYHSKQYLKDLVVTNHILLTFLDDVMQIPEYICSTKMIDHIRQFATPAVMAQYGRLLEDFFINEGFVNDCVFTLMHHVGGDGDSLDTLFQPNILKTFSVIYKSKFKICNDWTDLIKNVIYTFVNKTDTLFGVPLFLKLNEKVKKLLFLSEDSETSESKKNILQTGDKTQHERWTENEISTLSWNYLQCSSNPDVIGAITKQLKEDNINKSRTSVVRELFRQNLITKDFHESQLKGHSDKNTKTVPLSKESRDEEIRKVCEQLKLDGKSSGLEWVQKVLLEICYAKLHKQKKELQSTSPMDLEIKFKNFECFRNKHAVKPIISPVVYHSLRLQESVPLVPWNCQQANICKDLKFLQLLHKLGFQMPVDTGRVFMRIPHAWTAEFIYMVAGKILPIDTSTLKFSVYDLSNSENSKTKEYPTCDVIKDGSFVESSDSLYQIKKPNIATMVNFMPRSASTFTSANAIEQLNWLQLVKKSQQCKLTLNLKSITEATTEDIITKSPFGDGDSTSAIKSQVTVTNTAGLIAPLKMPTTSVLVPTTCVMLSSTSIIMPTTSEVLHTKCDMQSATSVTLPFTSVMLPILSIKQEIAPDNVQQEAWCDRTLETASVSTDLKRMYVSEGDEKPVIFARSGIAVAGGSDTTAGESAAARKKNMSHKRRRVLTKHIKRTILPTTVGSENQL